MITNTPLFFASAGDERGTPQAFFDMLDKEFQFNLDAAATRNNHKCELFFGDGGLAPDALSEDWGGPETTVFLNPPYSKVAAFVAKAREEADKGTRVVLLLPVRSDTRWWHTYIWNRHVGTWQPGVSTRFLPGRLQFELHVPPELRVWIETELKAVTEPKDFHAKLLALVQVTGLPRMAIERIYIGQPDTNLLDAAPFPSCVIVMEQDGTEHREPVITPAIQVPMITAEPTAPRLKRKYTRRGR